MTPETEGTPRAHRRLRGWLLSFAAMLAAEAALMIVLIVAVGPPSGDALYFTISPKLAVILLFGTPVTYLVAWRRPRPFHQVLLRALPVFLVLLGISLQTG